MKFASTQKGLDEFKARREGCATGRRGYEQTPLWMAATTCQTDAAKALLEAGCEVATDVTHG